MAMTSKQSARLGWIGLAPGVTAGNGLTLLLAMFFVGILAPYINVAQPYILTEHLAIPKQEQGVVSGNLAFWAEVVLIALSGIMGAWSDSAGRRFVFAFGLGVVALSCALYPLAGSYPELLVYRLVYAVGMSAIGAMSVALMAAYPANSSRGKLAAMVGVLSIFGFLFVAAVLSPLPARFVDSGASAVAAGRYAYWVTAAIAVVGTVIVWFGLSQVKAARDSGQSLLQRLRTGLIAARRNPRIALAYAAAFVGRTDLVVVTVFLSLWITLVSVEQGETTAEGLSQAGTMFLVLLLAGLLFTPVMGVLADRLNRVVALAVATGLAMAGYTWLGLLDQPTGPQAYPAAALLGMGQASAILAATALVGQEVDDSNTGAVSGLFSLFGAVGILLATKIGGMLFDDWMPGGPFIVTGIINGLVVLAALATILMGRHLGPELQSGDNLRSL